MIKISGLFHLLAQLSFTTNETELDHYRVASSQVAKRLKGTLMQISKSQYMFVFIYKRYPENFAFKNAIKNGICQPLKMVRSCCIAFLIES